METLRYGDVEVGDIEVWSCGAFEVRYRRSDVEV